MKGRFATIALATAALSLGCSCKGSKSWGAGAGGAAAVAPPLSAPTSSAGPLPALPPPPAGSIMMPSGVAPMSFSSVVKACDPSVVFIAVKEEARTRSGGRRTLKEGLGSGFIYDPNGYVLTNNHVVADATTLLVRLADDRVFDAKLVGRDALTDVAVLKIELTNAPYLPLGDSGALDVGDWVVAIGNPFGLSHTVSAGIISAKGRTSSYFKDLDRTGRAYFNFLQTDTAINPGNSGGPLINLKGEVVGINTAVRAMANNVGFAIPIDMVKALVPMLVRDGKISRSAMGVNVQAVEAADALKLGRPSRKGALVEGVQPGGGADRAGIAVGDIVIGFNGVPIESPEDLRWRASLAGVGASMPVKIARGKREFDVTVTLGALPDVAAAPAFDPDPGIP